MTARNNSGGTLVSASPESGLFLRNFLTLLAPALALVVVFLVIVFSFLVPLLEQNYLQQKSDLCRRMVESALSNLESYRADVAAEGQPIFAVQYHAAERLRELRFGEESKDYYWIVGPDGSFLMHPYRPDLEGQDPATVVGPDGEVLAVLIDQMKRAVEPGADGMIAYRWHWKDDLDRLVDKISYVDRYEPWGWIVGTGVYVDDVEAEMVALRSHLVLAGLLMTVLSAGLALILSLRGVRLQRSAAEAHARLAASEENLRITLQSIGDAVIATDTDGRVHQMNAVAEDLTGWSYPEADGRSLSEVFCIVDEITDQPIASPVDQVLATGEVVVLANHTLLVTRSGQRRRVADSGAPIRDRAGKVVGVVLVFRDVTEEHALQERLRQVQKMEVVGQLAGGVAHDFNNMLAAIMGNAELLDLKLAADSPLRPQVTMIINGAHRAADLTRKLLTFSRKGKLRSTALGIHEPIREAIGLLRRSLDRNIHIETRFEADADQVVGDPTLLQNAILNLAVNARDAMPEGGLLTFTTANVEFSADTDDLPRGIDPGLYVEVAVSDTGVGIPAELQDKVFEPFYTTKPVGKGTGLGLATVYGTVTEHQGAISLDSVPGQGTTVRILLPQDDQQLTLAPEADTRVVRGQGVILVVDDEDLVRGMAEAQLVALGYDVLQARDGIEALEIYKAYAGRVAVVLLDLVMPRLGGRETLMELRSVDPDARVVISTGYDPAGAAVDLKRLGATGFIAKPYRQAALSQAIGAALADRIN